MPAAGTGIGTAYSKYDPDDHDDLALLRAAAHGLKLGVDIHNSGRG